MSVDSVRLTVIIIPHKDKKIYQSKLELLQPISDEISALYIVFIIIVTYIFCTVLQISDKIKIYKSMRDGKFLPLAS